MAALKLVVALIACMLVVAPLTQAAITCNQVVRSVYTCIPYITGFGPRLPSCCAGVRNLINAARTRKDSQTACQCLRGVARFIHGIKPNLAANLPRKCRISIPYKISPSTNCTLVN